MFMLLTAFVLLVMTACGTADTDENANGENQGNGSSEVVENEEEAVEEETETETEEQVEEQEGTQENASETDENVIREEAAYVGMADPHTIEVNTETETIALQILDVEGVNFEEIEENAHVVIEYYKNDEGQNVLTDIEVN